MADVLTIPGPNLLGATLRYSSLPRSADAADPNRQWRKAPLAKDPTGWWHVDLTQIPDGTYEYDFEIDTLINNQPTRMCVPDPYAKEIDLFDTYRGIFRIENGARTQAAFDWTGELGATPLPENNEMVIYELPVRWMSFSPDSQERQVGLGTFSRMLFDRLDHLKKIGANCIELLPVQDSTDTLNWGYGTRFFFTTDYDMGTPYDLKLFIKSCHQAGIRVILDVVMNHAKKCPLSDIAYDWFFTRQQQDRNAWGGDLFQYDNPSYENFYAARQFHYDMAQYWIREFHIDGFRLDEVKGIANYDFLRGFRENAWNFQQQFFQKSRPFIVIGEDSARRADLVQDFRTRPKLLDSTWDFCFRDEVRLLASNDLGTELSGPSRGQRAIAMIRGDHVIDGMKWRKMHNPDLNQYVDARFSDLSQRITYCSSHDVEQFHEQRLFPHLLEKFKNAYGTDWLPCTTAECLPTVFEQVVSTFALTLTAVGIPMFLAGECFSDLHDSEHFNWKQKMQDPVDYHRMDLPGHKETMERITELIRLRTQTPALKRNEVEFFGIHGNDLGFHPEFDLNPNWSNLPLSEEGEPRRVFAYCRTNGLALGSPGQVIVVANCGPHSFSTSLFSIEWKWTSPVKEHGGRGGGQLLPVQANGRADIELLPFQVRVFST